MPEPRPRTLLAEDGVRLEAVHDPAVDRDLAFVVAHGFTGSWRRPAVRALSARLGESGGVVGFDFRGHGNSGGASTVGDREVLDVEAAVRWARLLGYRRVVTTGWSMGASVVLRHAALHGGVDAVVSVSGPARWYYRGTRPMRRLHLAIEHPVGRFVARHALHTRISTAGWDPLPASPTEVVGRIAPTPLLIVHGDADPYFPVEHGEALYAAALEPKELWVEHGMGHAEAAAGAGLVDRIAAWAEVAVGRRLAG
jgi:pimeloyl-ACP methyl ester carboxylesterase